LNRFLALQARGSDTARADTRWLRDQVLEGDEPDPEGLSLGLEWLADSDLRDELGGIAVPVHLIGGERDTLVPPAALEATASLLGRARVSVIPGAGHAPFISHRAAFLEALELPHG
jgi:pimeloyl-[acyl-carrier protein] methyl ester esterase